MEGIDCSRGDLIIAKGREHQEVRQMARIMNKEGRFFQPGEP